MRKAAQAAADKQRDEEQAEQRRVRLGEDPRHSPRLPVARTLAPSACGACAASVRDSVPEQPRAGRRSGGEQAQRWRAGAGAVLRLRA